MYGIDARFGGNANDVVDVEIGVDRALAVAHQVALVGFGPMQRKAVFARVDRDRANTEFGRRAHHANGNFAAICDEEASDGAGLGKWIHLRMMIALGPADRPEERERTMFGLAIHGGAGTLPRAEMNADQEAAVPRVASPQRSSAGFAVLESGGTSLMR